jgi:hypothetical protein
MEQVVGKTNLSQCCQNNPAKVEVFHSIVKLISVVYTVLTV